MRKELIDFMLGHSGKLPGEMTWYDVAVKFSLELPDKTKERSKQKLREALAKKANDIWRTYIKTMRDYPLQKKYIKMGNLLLKLSKRNLTLHQSMIHLNLK